MLPELVLNFQTSEFEIKFAAARGRVPRSSSEAWGRANGPLMPVFVDEGGILNEGKGVESQRCRNPREQQRPGWPPSNPATGVSLTGQTLLTQFL